MRMQDVEKQDDGTNEGLVNMGAWKRRQQTIQKEVPALRS